MKLGLWLRLLWILGAYCGCGGSEFEGLGPVPEASVAIEPDPAIVSATPPDASSEIRRAVDASAEIAETGGPFFPTDRDDVAESSSPAADSARTAPQIDAALEELGAPPPALCCVTPCSGSSSAAIACGNGPAWTCAAGSCSDRACAVGGGCMWMGSCVGRVEVCP